MSTEILERRVEEKKSEERVVTKKILPCRNQIFSFSQEVLIYDITDWMKYDHPDNNVLRTTKSPFLNTKNNCSGCINDEGNFMCKNYTPALMILFDVKEKPAIQEDYLDLPDVPADAYAG